MVEAELFVRYAQSRLVHAIHQAGRVLAERHDEEGTHIVVRAPSAAVADLRAQLERS